MVSVREHGKVSVAQGNETTLGNVGMCNKAQGSFQGCMASVCEWSLGKL